MTSASNAVGRTSSMVTQTIGDRFLGALTGRDFPTLASCFAEDTQFRALTPRALRTASGVSDPTRYFQQWFGAAERVELLASTVEALGARLHLSWRLRVHDEAGRNLIEQQAFATIRGDRIAELDLLCSGFQREHVPVSAGDPEGRDIPFAVAAALEAPRANCATLTPLIKATLADLTSGQVLEVITSEPSAGRDIASWCSLTGNPLLTTRSVGAAQHYYVRKK